MIRFILLFLITPLIAVAADQEPYYFTSSLKKGEGVYSLLNRYELNNSCNLKAFYEINNLKENAAVHSGKQYKLPVKIYKYDGRSIRSSIGISSWETAVRIKEYNELILKKGIRRTHYADSKILWVPLNLVTCELGVESKDLKPNKEPTDEKLNPQITKTNIQVPKKANSSKKGSNNLFGPNYKSFDIVDQSLKNQVFYIVSGHGGPDPGAMCTDHSSDLCEDEYAYDVCLRLARNLMQHGAIVEIIIQDKNDGIRDEQFLACDRDEKCGPNDKIPLNQKKRLAQRVSRINRLYKKYKAQGIKTHKVVVVHVDANRASKRQDVFFYHHKNSKTGKRMAQSIHSTFEQKYARYQKGRGYHGSISSRGLYMINYTHPPTVYIELGNIKNHQDQKRLLLNSNRQALANWLFEGLIAN